jgi:hypothetical protein
VVLALVLGVAAPALLAGCGGGDNLPREALSGTVNFDGAPLKAGTIQFQPTSAKEAVAASAGVADGRFSIPVGEGLVPGKYLVMINGVLGAPAPAPEGMPGDARPPKAPAKELIPEKYNARSELTREVTRGGPNTFDFDLKSK